MKQIKILFITSIVLIASFSNAQNIKSTVVKGNGNIIKQVICENKISELVNSSAIDIQMINDDSYDIIIEIDENLIQYLLFDNVKSKLSISPQKKKVIIPTKAVIYVPHKHLRKLTCMGSGNLMTNKVSFDKIDFINMGTGEIILRDIKLIDSKIINMGTGSITLSDVKYNILYIENKGLGNVSLINEGKETIELMDIINLTLQKK